MKSNIFKDGDQAFFDLEEFTEEIWKDPIYYHTPERAKHMRGNPFFIEGQRFRKQAIGVEVSNYGRIRHLDGTIPRASHRGGYISYRLKFQDGTKIECLTVRLHQLIMHTFKGCPPDGFVIDHIHGKRWQNELWNLRFATLSENARNRAASGAFPEEMGVSWHSQHRTCQVQISHYLIQNAGNVWHIGYHPCRIFLASVYKLAANLLGITVRNTPRDINHTHRIWLREQIDKCCHKEDLMKIRGIREFMATSETISFLG